MNSPEKSRPAAHPTLGGGPDSRRNLALGVIMVIAAGALLSGMDGTAKRLTTEVPLVMVLWGRYFFHALVTFVVIAAGSRSLGFLRAKRPGLQTLRAATLLMATTCMYFALTMMPLADATSIQFFAPVLVTAFSVPLLGERVGARRWAAVVLGFLGVLLVARPGSGVLGWAALLPLAAAVGVALYMILTRIMRAMDSPAATAFYSTALGALALSLLVPGHWQALSPSLWVLMVAMGTAGALGHFLLIRAFHLAPASFLAPFTYAQLVASVIYTGLFFDDRLSPWTLAGGFVVVGSGIYVWYRETYSKER